MRRTRPRWRTSLAGTAFGAALASALGASAAPAKPPPAAAGSSAPTNLKAQVGTEHAARLLRSPDADERIRGIERAASIGTPEAIGLLVDALERSPHMKADTRALLATARALAPLAGHERARAGLLAIVGAGGAELAGHHPGTHPGSAGREDDDPIARAELARQVAAIALARGGGDRALEALYGTARAGGSGQGAALVALALHPPREPGFFGTKGASMPEAVVRLLGALGDLRALDVLHAAARSTDVDVRCAALVALAGLGDQRAALLAREAIAAADVRLRAAAGETFVLLGAPERLKSTAALLTDDATAEIGVRLAERVFTPEITKLLAARAAGHADRDLRAGAIRALGRSPDPDAAKALVAPALLADATLAYDALSALARSPAPNAGGAIAGLLEGRSSSLAARAYVVRALVRGERTRAADDALARLARSRVATERALGAFGQIALGDADLDRLLDDADPRVRRAAAMGSLARPPSKAAERALLARAASERDTITRQVLGVGLLGGDRDATITTSSLVDRSESGGGDAPLAAFALARRAGEEEAEKITLLLGSKDVLLRAHAARGLAFAPLPDASGRLADAYAFETDVGVRRAIIGALAARTRDASAPARRRTLELAADLDPDATVRAHAARALAPGSAALASPSNEVAWLRIARGSGEPPGEPFVGSVVRADGVAVPVVFDEQGHALVPGLPPGDVRVVLAPRLPTYEKVRAP